MGKFILITIVLVLAAGWTHSASIGCEPNQQCRKISLFYQEIGCKAIKTSKSCCPKRFECPDFKKSGGDDDTKNISYMRRGCLPVFRADKDTPVDWKCPTATAVRKEEDSLPVKKIVKRQSPSQNLEAYLGDVKSDEDFDTTTTTQQIIEDDVTTVLVPLPTLSVDPFLAPLEYSTSNFFINIAATTPESSSSTQFADDTTTSVPNILEEESSTEERFATDQSVESDLMMSTTTEKISTTTQAIKEAVRILSNEIQSEKLIAATTDATTTVDTETDQSQSRELHFLNLPQPLSPIPFKPPVISTSSETIRATPSELASILTALKEILSQVESIAKKSANEDAARNHHNRKRRAVEQNKDEVKQKIINIKGCSFDGHLFKVGEKITTVKDACIECFCEYAPIGHCVVKQDCQV